MIRAYSLTIWANKQDPKAEKCFDIILSILDILQNTNAIEDFDLSLDEDYTYHLNKEENNE